MARLSSIVHNAFGVKGLCLNNQPGKSSVMPVLRGPTAREVRLELEATWDQGLSYPTLAGLQAMPLVESYKRLGVLMDFTASLESEIQSRIIAARQEVRALTKHVFGNTRIPLKARLHFFASVVLSKVSFMVGTWRELRAGEAKAWRHGVSSRYRCMLPVKDRYEAATWSVDKLCKVLGTPHPDTIVMMARARVFAALQSGEDKCVCHTVVAGSGDHSWAAAIARDHRLLADRSITPREPLALLPTAEDANLQCPLCSARFRVRKQLSAHAKTVHNVGSVARFFSPASHTCYVCCQQLATRQKLVSHLSIWSHTCLEELMMTYHPLEVQHVAALDKQARDRRNATGSRSRFSDECRALPITVKLQQELERVGDSSPRKVPVLCSEDLPGCSQLMPGPRVTFLQRPN